MKWKTETNPRSGEQHIAEYFAVIPTALDDGYTVWLQKYYAIETWDDGTTGVGLVIGKQTELVLLTLIDLIQDHLHNDSNSLLPYARRPARSESG